MDHTEQMKVLLEAVDAPKVDEPEKGYANTPHEQTLDSATQQNFGRDLHKKKSYQHPSRDGDNARAAKLTQYTLEEERLTKAFKKFKLNEGLALDTKWTTERELAKILSTMINADDDLEHIVSKDEFDRAHFDMMAGDAETAADDLLGARTTGDGGERQDSTIVRNDVVKMLASILDNRVEQALETAGDSTGESETLKALHHKGVDNIDGVKAKVFGPTESYPLPWTAKHVGGKYPIYSIKAGNKAEVATWLNQTDVLKVIDEIT